MWTLEVVFALSRLLYKCVMGTQLHVYTPEMLKYCRQRSKTDQLRTHMCISCHDNLILSGAVPPPVAKAENSSRYGAPYGVASDPCATLGRESRIMISRKLFALDGIHHKGLLSAMHVPRCMYSQ